MNPNLISQIKEYIQVSEASQHELMDKVASLESQLDQARECMNKTAALHSTRIESVVDVLINTGNFDKGNRDQAITLFHSDPTFALDCLEKMAMSSKEVEQPVLPSLGRPVDAVSASNENDMTSDRVWTEGIRRLARYNRETNP